MPTHAIGRGTCNLSLNVRSSEASLLALTALRKGYRSVGAYTKHLVLVGLETDNPEAALRLRAIRNGARAAALTVLICASTVLSWVNGDTGDAMRRASGQRVRVVARREEMV